MRRNLHALSTHLQTAVAAIAMLGVGTGYAATVALPSGAVLGIPNPNLRTVEVDIDNAAGIEALLLRIQYNRGVAVAGSVRKTSITNDCAMEVNTATPNNEVQISLACTSPLTGSGPLFEIDFSGANAGVSDLTFLECSLNEGSPNCDVSNGDLRVTTCLLDVDSSGAAFASTDGVYLFRALPPSLQTIVPLSFRDLLPGIPEDPVILDNVDSILPFLDVDDRNGAQASTDGVYLFRAMPPTLQTIVPADFRQLDPSIPSDQVIGATVQALCP